MRVNRRQFLTSSAACAGLGQARPPGARRPNVLLITDDQHNARNLGCYGDPLVRTPALDRLAGRGVRFNRAYTTNMICAPARVSMITGQYVHSHGYFGNSGPQPDRLWLSTHLRRGGYQTAMIGKAHYGWPRIVEEFDYIKLCDRIDCPPDDPLKNDYFRFLLEKGAPGGRDRSEGGGGGPNNPRRSSLPAELSVEAWTSDKTIDFLRARDKDRPFFAFVSYQRPHAPITPPAPYDSMYKPSEVPLPPSARETLEGKPAEQLRAAQRSGYPYHPADLTKLQAIMAMYFGLITLIDDQIDRILKELDAQGAAENTLIIFTADHGDFSGEHGFFHKGLGMYEAIHHVPFILAGPGIGKGLVREEFAQLTDIYPTACEVAGLPIPKAVQGHSLLPLCGSAPAWWPRTAAFAEQEGRMCIRTDRYRMVFDAAGDANELYDHSRDPWEMKNVFGAAEYRAARLELTEEVLRYYDRTQQQTLATTLKVGGGGGYMPPGPTHDLWWKGLDWDTVQKKYNLTDPRPASAPR